VFDDVNVLDREMQWTRSESICVKQVKPKVVHEVHEIPVVTKRKKEQDTRMLIRE
jgi:hypothetical protein